MSKEQLDHLLKKELVIPPPEEFVKNANVKDYEAEYKRFLENPEKFWEEVAQQLIWFKKWEKVLEWNYPYAKWFVGGKTNITVNALDRHVKGDKRNKVAFFWEDELGNEKVVTYGELYRLVNKLANALKRAGIKKGDRVVIYMPLVIEQVAAMLACARIGAIHSVVYAGFSASALRHRIEDAEAKMVITADVTIRRGRAIPLKQIVDQAILDLPTVEKVVVLRRLRPLVDLIGEKEVDFYSFIENEPDYCEPEEMDAEDPLFILYTSGSTGKPKGVLHTTGGYMVGTYYSVKTVFDLKEDDVYWCTADPGWITGHSYIVYGPLVAGATQVIAEGAPNYPDFGRWWRIVEKYGVNIFYTAPTAIRMFMRAGEEWPNKYDLSSLRLLGSVGEPINPEAWLWYYRVIGKERCPIVDTWWQTETGAVMITTIDGLPMKPGKAGKPVPGVIADVVDKEGNPVEPEKGGFLVIKFPWPSMMRTIWKNPQRYEQYWNTIPNCYTAGDVAVKDKDGYIMILGRADDVINVSGHRIGTMEVESALVSHPAVAEAAVIGKPDPVKGEAIKAFVILKAGVEPSDKLVEDLKYHVKMELGALAVPSEIEFVEKLPKTRSGKIMRRVLKARELGIDPGDLSTLED
ncbi:acetate/CoA ligase [Thermovibrio ammonificans HB-1]|uniref:Acetate--CoA ligase n=1 Tax=Thermovibrio ammonificans (strain DSM 15698 / JCM 12110 / HB-1) TaxID=648996 RepID=E8T5P5_THEA1|nr:acetate--CoA ligase [Thermovibrio ammonificans]ADU96520.1 acetate/CoA ligase [Thermovibrio ammonificans HB-1]